MKLNQTPSFQNSTCGEKLMLAIPSHSPQIRTLLERTAALTKKLGATWFVVHVREKATLHYGAAATEHPVPEADLDYARKLGARVVLRRGDVASALARFARVQGIRYFVSDDSQRPRFTLPWHLPLPEKLHRQIPGSVLIAI